MLHYKLLFYELLFVELTLDCYLKQPMITLPTKRQSATGGCQGVEPSPGKIPFLLTILQPSQNSFNFPMEKVSQALRKQYISFGNG